MEWYIGVLKQYAVFTGRAHRQEFWMFVLINFGIIIGLSILAKIISILGILGILYNLAVLLPSIGVGIRRLHDTDRSGWWILIGLVPVVGWIVLIIFAAMEGKSAENKYGPNPISDSAADA